MGNRVSGAISSTARLLIAVAVPQQAAAATNDHADRRERDIGTSFEMKGQSRHLAGVNSPDHPCHNAHSWAARPADKSRSRDASQIER